MNKKTQKNNRSKPIYTDIFIDRVDKKIVSVVSVLATTILIDYIYKEDNDKSFFVNAIVDNNNILLNSNTLNLYFGVFGILFVTFILFSIIASLIDTIKLVDDSRKKLIIITNTFCLSVYFPLIIVNIIIIGKLVIKLFDRLREYHFEYIMTAFFLILATIAASFYFSCIFYKKQSFK